MASVSTAATAPIPEPLASEVSSISPARVRGSMVGVVLALLMGSLDQTIVATAMPRIVAELHGFSHYAGVVSGYLIASTIAIPIAGRLSDIYGRKRFFEAGVALFVIASMLCGTAASMTMLIVFRCLQGIGGGTMQAMAFTTIADLFPPARRGRVSGLMGAMFGVSSVLGPTLGGVLTDAWGWRSVFTVNLPVGIVTFAVLWQIFPDVSRSDRARARIDWLGGILLTCGIGSALLLLSAGGREVAWRSWQALGLLLVASVALTLFVRQERRSASPIVAFELFRTRVISQSLLAASLIAFGLMGTTLFAPLFLQAVLGVSARESGMALIPMSVCAATGSFCCGQLVQRTGRTRPFSLMGCLVAVTGVMLLTRVDTSMSTADVTHRLMVVGLGSGMTMPIFSLIVQNAAPRHLVGSATASVQFVRAMGGSLGVALMGTLLATVYSLNVHQHLDHQLAVHLTPSELQQLDDPQQLLRPHEDHLIGHTLGSSSGTAVPQATRPEVDNAWRAATRGALAQATRSIFWLATAVVLLGFFAVWNIEELPLRRSNRATGPDLHH